MANLSIRKLPERMTDIFQKYFGRKHGVDLKLPHKHVPHSPVKISRK